MELFLDANAHLPLNKKALKKYVDFQSSRAGHGHAMSPSVPGRAAQTAIEESREKIARYLGASAEQIIFTNTCTHACEWAIKILHNLIAKNKFSEPYISQTEHPAVWQAVKVHFDARKILMDKNGIIDVEQIPPDAFVICIMLQNELGIIHPVNKINCGFIFSDMSQVPGKIDFSLDNIDMAVFGAHKFGGPVNVGILYLKNPQHWVEFGTGSRYFMDRCGTPDAASVVAAATALQEAKKTLPARTKKMLEFRDILESGLEKIGFEIVAKKTKRCPNTTFVHMSNGGGLTNMMRLGEKNIHVGLGSACGSVYTGTSPLMKALGREGGPNDYMRISHFGEYGKKEAEFFLQTLKKVK